MHFNTKVIEYPNGEIQVRKYSKPLYKKDDRDVSWLQIKMRNNKRRNPFDNKVCMEFVSIQQLEETIASNKYRSCNRTKQSVYTYARCCSWEYFITLTLSKEHVDRFNYDECSKKVRVWLNNQKRSFAPNLKYLLVPEQHKDGAWHFHGLLADIGTMSLLDSGKKDKGNIIYNLNGYKFGFTTATKVLDIHKVAKYIGKYVTKSISDKLPNQHRYFVSNNLPKPLQYTLFLESDDEHECFMEYLQETTQKEIKFISNTSSKDSYTQTTYIELL